MLILRWFPCFVFFLAAFKIFSLSLAFNIFRMTCLGMDLFVFILEFNKLLGYVDFLKSLSHYSSNIYLSLYVILMLSFSLLSFWNSHYVYAGMLNSISHFSEALFIFFTLFSFCSSDCIISIDLSSSLLFISSAGSNLLLSPLMSISFWLLSFQFQNFNLSFLKYNFFFLIDIPNLMRHYHHLLFH